MILHLVYYYNICIGVIATILGAGAASFNTIIIKDRTRTGSGNGRYYFETYTKFYGDSKYLGKYFTTGSRR